MGQICGACGAPLSPGGQDDLESRAGSFHITYRGMPLLKCPRGCPGGIADPSVSLMGILKLARQVPSCVAKRKGIFSKRPVCRACGVDLVETGAEHTWTLGVETEAGSPLELVMTGPALLCPKCQTYFIPSDERSRELVQAVSGALSAPSEE